jgi:hypothetical protein
MRIQPEVDTVNIVFVGNFNPIIFRPEWFGGQDLLTPGEVAAADIEIIHPEIAIFSVDWLKVWVDRRRFIVETSEPPYVRLQDLVARTFGECLYHTPVETLGINRSVHFPVIDLKTRDQMGNRLAPQTAWGEWGQRLAGTPEKRGGLRSITMEQADPDDRDNGYIRAKVERSPQLRIGVFVDINDHYVVGRPDETLGCERAVATVTERFDSSLKRSAWIIDQVMALAQEVGHG